MENREFKQSKKNPGIVTNLPTTDVSWSWGRNVRFTPGAVSKVLGKSLLGSLPSPLPIRNMFTFRWYDDVQKTLICCDNKLYIATNDFVTIVDVTPTPAPTSGATDTWTMAVIGGMPIFGNGVDGLWKITESGVVAMTGTPARARIVSSHHHRLLVGNLQEGAYDYPGRIKWSSPYEPESFSFSTKSEVDRRDIRDPNGDPHNNSEYVIGIGHLGKDRKVIYTDRNVWGADPIEGPLQHSLPLLLPGKGLLAPRLRVNVNGQEYFLGTDDVYKLGEDGGPLGFPMRNFIFPNLNQAHINKSFSYYKPATKEIVFCVPMASSTVPDVGISYNIELKSFGIQEVDYLCHSYAWLQSPLSWDTLTYGSWDTISDSRWDDMFSTGVIPYDAAGDANGNILKLDDGYNNNGSAIQGFIETGDMYYATNRIQSVCMYPQFKPTNSEHPVMIQVGVRESLHHDIRWSQPQAFYIGVSEKVDFLKSGKYVRYRFYTDQKNSPWILEGYQTYFNVLGG